LIVRISGRFLLVIVIVLTVFRVDRIVTGKFLLEPAPDGLKCPGGLVSDGLPELDNRRSIPIGPLANGFPGMVGGFLWIIPSILIGRLTVICRRRIDIAHRRRRRTG
jgi:hypothetical protein